MIRSLLSTVVLTGAMVVLPAALTAQMPRTGGGAGQSPSTSPTVPGQNNSGQNPNGLGPNDQPANTPTSKVDDKKFVKEAAEGGLAEVELGKLAAQKAASPDVKQFGQKMVDDHTKANDQLKEIASKENISVPDTLDHKYQSKIDKLSKLSGDQFDKAYVKDMVKDHESDLREFQAEAQGGMDPNIKAFASSTLPTLQQHLASAKDLNKTAK